MHARDGTLAHIAAQRRPAAQHTAHPGSSCVSLGWRIALTATQDFAGGPAEWSWLGAVSHTTTTMGSSPCLTLKPTIPFVT